MKARLDIKVAIYKEPASELARARADAYTRGLYTYTPSIIRISIHVHARMHIYIRRRRAKEDTRRDRSDVFAYRER